MALDTESGSPLQCSSMVYVSKESCVHKWNEPCLLLLLSSRHYCPLFFCYLFCAMALCLSVTSECSTKTAKHKITQQFSIYFNFCHFRALAYTTITLDEL